MRSPRYGHQAGEERAGEERGMILIWGKLCLGMGMAVLEPWAGWFAGSGLFTAHDGNAVGPLRGRGDVASDIGPERRATTEEIKPIERLVPVSSVRCRTCTPGLSTWWSSTALEGYLVLRGASRLDAFSGYPVRT